jgi:hypothetical protein
MEGSSWNLTLETMTINQNQKTQQILSFFSHGAEVNEYSIDRIK